MSNERKQGGAPQAKESPTGTPRELNPARSKSVETVEREVDEIVDALAARERERARQRGPAKPEP